MTVYVSMLRGVNVGGNKVKMTELRDMYMKIGARNVETYIQSGNVVFDTDQNEADMASRIESIFADTFGFETAVIMRTEQDMNRIVDNMPFAGVDTDKLHVTFLSAVPEIFPHDDFSNARQPEEKFANAKREIYVYCPRGYGRTKLNNNLIEKKL